MTGQISFGKPALAGPRQEKLWSLKGLHILIVDDYPQVRAMLREMLIASGADDIVSVKSGEDALRAMAEQTPDIVLCDYHLGDGKDGQQVLEEARENDWLPYSSIFVLVTAENTLKMVMGVVEHEPDAYLTKPFTRVVLQTRLRRLQKKKAQFAPIARAVSRGEYLKACQLCDEAIARLDRYRFDLLKIKGDALQRAGDYQAAEALYRQVLEERELSWAQLGLGKVLFHQHRSDESIQVLKQAIAARSNFVAAFDWLAKAQAARGETEASEATLQTAVELSPKNLRRQKALGRAARLNGHLDVAESAYKTVLREGRHSIFGSPSDYGELADVYIKGGQQGEAVKLLGRMERTYGEAGDDVRLKMAIVEAQVQAEVGKPEESRKALKRAQSLFDEHPEVLGREEVMALAEACFASGDPEAGKELIQHVVRANHEDEDMLDRARAIFAKAGMQAEGDEIIAAERKAMIQLNNNAVALAKQGKLKESSSMLLKAAQAMPENVAINLNAAQTLLMLMQKDGASWPLLRQVQDLLRRVGGEAANNSRYPKLLDMAQTMERSLA